jgi:hypothetical protein
MTRALPLFFAPILLLVLAAGSTLAAEPDSAGVEFFEKNIRPILVDRCYNCHSAKSEKIKGKLLLDTRQGVSAGGEGGPIIIPGHPEKSRLITALQYTDPDMEMPPKHQVEARQIEAFEQWVKMGAPDPRADAPGAAPNEAIDPYNWEEAKKFWSFLPIQNPPVPQASDGNWPLSPIDNFLMKAYAEHGLKPVGQADKRALIRRATYDLTGLPPTPDEVEAFVADNSPDAYEKLIDRLLASPSYGEKWGRHWLDLVRYADTSGCNSDFPIPQIYKYRNYVIDSFNQDKSYDQFIREQLAGDLLPHKDAAQRDQQIVATGYLAIARRFGSRNNEFHLTIEDTIDNLGKVMLGLSVNCARCHDHKFDPIPTSDYYALYGIFDSTKYAFPGTEIYKHPKDLTPLGTKEEARAIRDYAAKLAELDDRAEKLLREESALASREKAMADKKIAPTTAPSTQPVRTSKDAAAELAITKEETRQMEMKPPPGETAFAVSEGMPHDAQIQIKGQPTDLGEKVPRHFLTVLGAQKLPTDEKGSGRIELARWITDPSNPLTARVMANRIWQFHFGVGIVKSPNDFGARGQRPTNAALLDYLATRFVQSGWSIKSMHRLIMLSRAYQMQSVDDPSDSAIDNANDYFWRQNPRRLSAEEIRDTILTVSGSLDSTMDGPHPFPPLNEWRFTQHRPFVADYPSNHRSIYLMQQRIRKQPYLSVFDGADTNATTPDRPISTTAIQALFMMNDPFMHDQADKLAVRIGLAFGDDASRIDYAYRLCFGRPPTPDEVQTGQQYIQTCLVQLKQSKMPWDHQYRAALESYMRVLMSSNEFVFLD